MQQTLCDSVSKLQAKVLGLIASRRLKRADYAVIVPILGANDWNAEAIQTEQFGEELSLLTDRSEQCLAKGHIECWAKEGIDLVPLGSEDYPNILTQLHDPPSVLFVRGQGIRKLNEKLLFSIVGSRASDRMSEALAHNAGAELAALGVTIVSGLALGIDSQAHRGALAPGLPSATIAVLGNGLSSIYPRSNTALANSIIESGGSLISEFEPDSPAYPANFLQRNRIIAGLSRGVLVIQAGDRSGSLVTARFALESGRDVFVAPGAFHDARFSGSNRLIKEGAIPCTSIEDIIDFYPELVKRKDQLQKCSQAISTEKVTHPILLMLKQKVRVHIDELSILELANNLQAELLTLELNGQIIRLPGNYISLMPK